MKLFPLFEFTSSDYIGLCPKHKLTFTKWQYEAFTMGHRPLPCKKCQYESRKIHILEQRSKHYQIRIQARIAQKKAAQDTIDCLKELYSS